MAVLCYSMKASLVLLARAPAVPTCGTPLRTGCSSSVPKFHLLSAPQYRGTPSAHLSASILTEVHDAFGGVRLTMLPVARLYLNMLGELLPKNVMNWVTKDNLASTGMYCCLENLEFIHEFPNSTSEKVK